MLTVIKKSAKSEVEYWQTELKKNGWTEDDAYHSLTIAKDENEKWIKQEAKQVGSRLETELIASLSTYIMKVKKNVKTEEIREIVLNAQKNIVDAKIDEWGEHLVKSYSSIGLQNYNIDKISLTPPTGITIAENIRGNIMALLDSIKYAGMSTVVGVSVGAVIFHCAGMPLIGALAGPIGLGVMAVAIIPLLPAINNSLNAQRGKKREVDNELNVWMKSLSIAPMIEKELYKENIDLFNYARQNMDTFIKRPLINYENANNIITGILELELNLKQQFEGVK